ncbi:MAG: hypothetical protein BM562_12035 [Alphaproteobacteria bacterium MedPE-SWcel]|nr:MAG: hypothetical protein BM562_12035 [Alphaproteobacteria bacterium MedPE-SWcel]
MIELLFVVCLSGQPTACSERSMVFVDVSPQTCLMGAQPELAKWVNTHPRHEIKSWRCRAVNGIEQEA